MVAFPSSINIVNSWNSAASDEVFLDAMRQSARHVRSVAAADGQTGVLEAAKYPNYALFDTPVEELFGGNVDSLRRIKVRVDPDNVMGLTGGFKI